MKKLGRVNICGIQYSVEEHSQEEDHNIQDCYGYTAHTLCKIVLREGMPPDAFRNTLLHEIQHGIWEHSGLAAGSHDQETHIMIFTPHLIAAMESIRKWKSL
jgi:hypothetical protein